MATNLIGSYPSMSTPPHNQVYNLTHDGDAKRSFVSRAYISFSYGGKDIEDFGLIATFSDDGKTGNLYGNFEDITSSYSMLDGQFYWGSHFTNNSLTFNLATDGMTQNELDDFKYWFRPGQADKELIVAEHPNRAILARVAQPPTYTLIPYRKKEWRSVDHTAEVRAIINQMGTMLVIEASSNIPMEVSWEHNVTGDTYYGNSIEEVYAEVAEAYGLSFTTLEGQECTFYKGTIQLIFTMDNPFWYLKKNFILIEDGLTEDNKKIMLEDGIPLQSEVLADCFYGGYTLFDNNTQWGAIASALSSSNPYNQVNYAILDEIRTIAETHSLSLNENGILKLIYSGNAPTLPILEFTLTPKLMGKDNLLTASYIYAPYNEYATGSGSLKYNSIYFKINDNIKTVFKFTTPEIYDSYNQVLNYVNTSYSLSWPEFIDLLKNSIRCAPVRAHAIQIAEYFKDQNESHDANSQSNFKIYMRSFLTGEISSSSNAKPANFIFNSATGMAIGKFKYYRLNNNLTSVTSSVDYEENVGSMVRSNYLVIEEKNQILNGEHQDWYTITTDYPGTLSNFLVLYNNMYY